MPDDYRIMIGYVDHPKIIALIMLCGAEGFRSHIKLIDFCAKTSSRTDGNLRGMSVTAIEIAAGWRGEPGLLVQSLLDPDVRLLDGELGDYSMHDWEDHQPWVTGAADRSAAAKKAAEARWAKTRGVMRTASTRNARRIDPQCPVSVSDTVSISDSDPVSVPVSKAAPKALTKQIFRVFGFWKIRHPDEFIQPHTGLREWCELERRLQSDGFKVEDIERAIDGIHLDDWGGRANNLTLMAVVKTTASVQRFIKMAENKGRVRVSDKTRRTMENLQSILDDDREKQDNAAE